MKIEVLVAGCWLDFLKYLRPIHTLWQVLVAFSCGTWPKTGGVMGMDLDLFFSQQKALPKKVIGETMRNFETFRGRHVDEQETKAGSCILRRLV